MFNKTVVPLDDRDESAAILPSVSGLAEAAGGEIVLLTVLSEDDFGADHVETRAPEGPTPEHTERIGPVVHASAPVTSHSGRTSSDISRKDATGGTRPRAAAMTEAIHLLETHAAKLRERGLSVSVKVTYGDPQREILAVIKDEDADSVAIATHRQSAIARKFKGSVTDEIIQMSPVPVLSMHAPGEGEPVPSGDVATVVVPVDGSEFSELAIGPAMDLAKSLDAEIVFVQTVESPLLATTAAAAPEMMNTARVRSTENLISEAEDYMQRLVERAESAGIKASAESDIGAASSAIVSIAEGREDSVVVMASHARSGLARTVFGSNADEVVRNLKRPVLIIKDESEE